MVYNKVLSATTGANTTRYVHDPMGIHSQENPDGSWRWMVKDGLGSVRQMVDSYIDVLTSADFDPYGVVWNSTGSNNTLFGYTGEPMDANGLVHLRARYYNPSPGIFASLDPFEGDIRFPMSLHGYGYSHGNPTTWTDPSGMIISLIIGGAIVGAAIAGGYEYGSQVHYNMTECDMGFFDAVYYENLNLKKIAAKGAEGAILGGIAGLTSGAVAGMGFTGMSATGLEILADIAVGSYSYSRVGSTPEDYAALAESINDVLFFAGEATDHINSAGVDGAFITGLRAAEEVIEADAD